MQKTKQHTCTRTCITSPLLKDISRQPGVVGAGLHAGAGVQVALACLCQKGEGATQEAGFTQTQVATGRASWHALHTVVGTQNGEARASTPGYTTLSTWV